MTHVKNYENRLKFDKDVEKTVDFFSGCGVYIYKLDLDSVTLDMDPELDHYKVFGSWATIECSTKFYQILFITC